MSDLGPGDMFAGLDDPTPPAFGEDLLPGVVRRGQHLRNQRRMAYAVGSACAAVLVAGAGIGLAGGTANNGTPTPPLSPAPTASHTKKTHHPQHTSSPGTTVGGNQPSRGGSGGHRPPKSCVSSTPTASPAEPTPSSSPTPTDSTAPTPLLTESPAAAEMTAPTPTPASTDCVTPPPSPEDPVPSESPSPTYSLPPLISDGAHARSGTADGIR